MITSVVFAMTTSSKGFTTNGVEVFSGYSNAGPKNARAVVFNDNTGVVTFKLYSIEANGEYGVRRTTTVSRAGVNNGSTYTNTEATRSFYGGASSVRTSGFVYCEYNF